MNLPDPANDRDEPTDEEIDEAVARSDTHNLAVDLMAADEDDRTILAIVRHAANGRTDITVVDDNGVPVAIVHDAADVPKVAAAPDLLEALEAAIRDHDDIEDGRLSGNTVAAIRAAIAKAKP